MKQTNVYIVADLSGSMQGQLEEIQRRMVRESIQQFAAASVNGFSYMVKLLPFSERVDMSLPARQATSLADSLVDRLTTRTFGMGGGTALRDAIGAALERIDEQTPSIVMVFTDGYENASNVWSAAAIKGKVDKLEATGNLTLTCAGPGSSRHMMSRIGIPDDNFRAWDGTVKEAVEMSRATVGAVQQYTQSRAMGARSTKRFYADPSNLTASGIKANTKQVTPSDIKQVTKTMAGRTIADLYGGNFRQGHHYYQLMKAEYIQEDKDLVVFIKDPNSKADGAGEYRLGSRSVRTLLGLPETGRIRVHPGPVSDKYKIFVQSSSTNRKLVEGQTMLTVD